MTILLLSAILFFQPDHQLNEQDLIYTTREFYFDVSTGCPMDGLCIRDFSMILTFDVGVTVQDEIKKISFKDADMEFMASTESRKPFQALAFDKFDHTFTTAGKKVAITFYPNKKEGAPMPPVTKCTFEGFVREKGGAAGTFTFYLKSGATYTVQFT